MGDISEAVDRLAYAEDYLTNNPATSSKVLQGLVKEKFGVGIGAKRLSEMKRRVHGVTKLTRGTVLRNPLHAPASEPIEKALTIMRAHGILKLEIEAESNPEPKSKKELLRELLDSL